MQLGKINNNKKCYILGNMPTGNVTKQGKGCGALTERPGKASVAVTFSTDITEVKDRTH